MRAGPSDFPGDPGRDLDRKKNAASTTLIIIIVIAVINLGILKHRIRHISLTMQEQIVSEALSFLPESNFVTDKVAEERLNRCLVCPDFDISSRKCNNCGCFVDLKTKVKSLPFMEDEKCPINKW